MTDVGEVITKLLSSAGYSNVVVYEASLGVPNVAGFCEHHSNTIVLNIDVCKTTKQQVAAVCHELAHLGTKEVEHTEKWKEELNRLLEIAEKLLPGIKKEKNKMLEGG